MTVVLDSNVWVSALRFGGTALRVLSYAFFTDRVALCREIDVEVRRVLGSKFKLSESEIDALLIPYRREAIHVEITGTLRTDCRDAKDDMILECALVAAAELVVTGDNDLLDMKTYRSIQIVTMNDYLAASGQAGR